MRRALVVLVVAAASVACGSEAPVSEAAAVQLGAQVQQVRSQAATGDAGAARAALADTRAVVDELRRSGELTDPAANRILAAAADVERNLVLITTTTTAAPTTTTTAAPTTTTTSVPKDERDDDDEDEEEENGKGKGRGRD